MIRFSSFFSAFCIALALFTSCKDDDNSTTPTLGNAQVRVIHASHDAPSVDVQVDNAVALRNIPFKGTSGYANVSEGNRNFKVTPANATSPVVINTTASLSANTKYTIIAADKLSTITPLILVDNATPSTSKAKVRFVHASADAPAVDIKVGSGSGTAVFSNVSFKQVRDYIEVDPGSYQFVVTRANQLEEVVKFNPINLTAGQVLTVVAQGLLLSADPSFSVRAYVDDSNCSTTVDFVPTQRSQIMVIHAVPNAPGVNIFANGNKLNSSELTFPNNTGYTAVNAGTYNLEVKVPSLGNATVINVGNFAVNTFTSYSIFATGDATNPANIAPFVLIDDLTTPAAGKAHVRFAHLAPDAPAVDIVVAGTTTKLFDNYAYKNAGKIPLAPFTPVDAGTYTLEVHPAGQSTTVLTLPNITLQAGKIYTVFAKGFLANNSLGAEIIVNK